MAKNKDYKSIKKNLFFASISLIAFILSVSYGVWMEKRIKIISGEDYYDLEDSVNYFLRKEKGKLHDVRMQSDLSQFYALLIYTPEDYEQEI